MEILVLVAFLGLIPAIIASRKGRSFLAWYLYGAALFIVALPHAILASDPRLVRCRHCAELMRAEAVVCPHCRRAAVEPAPMPIPLAAEATAKAPGPRPISEWKPPAAA